MKKLFILFFLIFITGINVIHSKDGMSCFDEDFFDSFVDNLHQKNKTVKKYIMQQHHVMHDEALKNLQKTGFLTNQDIHTIHEKISTLHNQLKKDTSILCTSNVLTTEECKYFEKLFTKNKLWGQFTLKNLKSSDNFHYGSEKTHIYANKRLTTFYLSQPLSKNLHGVNTQFNYMGVLLHEMAHAKKLHQEELALIESFEHYPRNSHNYTSAIPYFFHYREYEADQYYACKNIENARYIEKSHKLFVRNNPESIYHPSGEKRYQAVKHIRKMLEAEQRWYQKNQSYIFFNKYSQAASLF